MCPRAPLRVSPATSAPVSEMFWDAVHDLCMMQGTSCIQLLQGLISAAAMLQRRAVTLLRCALQADAQVGGIPLAEWTPVLPGRL